MFSIYLLLLVNLLSNGCRCPACNAFNSSSCY